MNEPKARIVQPTSTESAKRIPRHEHRVRTFSRNYTLITEVGDRYTVESEQARELVNIVTDRIPGAWKLGRCLSLLLVAVNIPICTMTELCE